jgi:hypothetical protein
VDNGNSESTKINEKGSENSKNGGITLQNNDKGAGRLTSFNHYDMWLTAHAGDRKVVTLPREKRYALSSSLYTK